MARWPDATTVTHSVPWSGSSDAAVDADLLEVSHRYGKRSQFRDSRGSPLLRSSAMTIARSTTCANRAASICVSRRLPFVAS